MPNINDMKHDLYKNVFRSFNKIVKRCLNTSSCARGLPE